MTLPTSSVLPPLVHRFDEGDARAFRFGGRMSENDSKAEGCDGDHFSLLCAHETMMEGYD